MSNEILATFRHDAAALAVGVALCTIAAGLAAFAMRGRRIGNMDLGVAGVLAAAYGMRLIASSAAAALLVGHPPWLDYTRAALEYLVPIPGAMLFERFFAAGRFRRINRFITAAFIALAAVAIPYEIVRRQPGAANGIVNTVVLVFMSVYVLNLFAPARDRSADWRLLRIGTAIFGAFVINAHFQFVRDPYGLTSEPVGFLIFIGMIVLVMIRHSERAQMRVAAVDGELAAARRIQMSIIPRRPPSVRGLDLAAVYLPASEVAGDFFDFIRAGDDAIGILIADVSGHGVPAALVASMLKIALATQTAHAAEPARLLLELNALFCGKLERQFITAAYAFIDAASGDVKVASAGHPPPLALRAGGTAEELLAPGTVLGRFPTATFGEVAAHLDRGDALVLYTDGVTEAIGAGGEMFGEARLRDAISAGGSAQQMAEGIVTRLGAWRDVLADDVTLVVAKRS